MNRKILLLFVVCFFCVSPLLAQQWAKSMFKTTEHDFGSCAHNARTEYAFVFENLYLEDVHVSDVRTSCGCTTPRVENASLKTYEKGAIVAHLNTDRFQGQRGATLTVTFDKPFYAEVQLHVRGYIRSDVSVEPGSVQFGAVDQGRAKTKNVSVNVSGHNGWRILDVKSANSHLKAQAVETSRNYNQVSYDLKVRLDNKAPLGYINDYLTVVTNDARVSQIPVLVEGRVDAGITVSPAALFMGVLQPGQKVTKQLIVKGKKPFKILHIQCDDKSFEFNLAAEKTPKALHVVPVTFLAGSEMGKVVKTIKIETEKGQFMPELSAYAVVASK
ncbi:MAG: DUF1573 domain-containing protein [Thermoguttaceae bacterium]